MSDDSFDASTLGWVDLPNPPIISDRLTFFDIRKVHPADQDLVVTFAFLEGNVVHPGDFVGIYKIEIKDIADSILKVVVNPDVMSVTFPAAELPRDDEAAYLLLYVQHENAVVGVSAPFKIEVSRPSTDDVPHSNPSSETALTVDDAVSDAESEEFLVVHSQLQEENSRLKTDLNRVLMSLAALKQEQEDAVIAFQKQTEKDKADMSQLQKELSDLKAEHRKVNTAADIAKTQLEEAKCSMVDYEGCQAEVLAEIHKVKNDLENATNEKSALADKLSKSEMQEQELQSTIKVLQKESLVSKEELIKLQKVLEEITNEKLALEDRLFKSEKAFEDRLFKSEKALEEVTSEKLAFESRLFKSEKQNHDLDKAMKIQAQRFAVDVNEKSLELIDAKEDIKRHACMIMELTERMRELKIQIRQKDEKLSEDVKVILTYHAQLQRLSGDRNLDHMDSMVDVKFLKDTLDANVAMLRAIEASKQLAVQELEADRRILAKLKADKTAKDEECNELKAEIDLLMRKSSEAMKAKEGECEALKAKCKELEHALLQEKSARFKECVALNDEIDTLIQEHTKATKAREAECNTLKAKCEELEHALLISEGKSKDGLSILCDCDLPTSQKLGDEEDEVHRLRNEDEQLEKIEQFVDALTDVSNVTVEQPKNKEPKKHAEFVVLVEDYREHSLSSENLTSDRHSLTGMEFGTQQIKQVVETGVDAENLCCKEVEEANAELKARLLEGAEIFKEQYQEVKGLKKEVKKLEILRKADEFHRKPFQPRGPIMKNMLMGMQRNYKQLAKKIPTVAPPPAVYVSDEEKTICTPPEMFTVNLIPRPVNDCDTGEPVEKVPSLVPVEAVALPEVEAQPLPKKAQRLPKEEAQPLPKKAQWLSKEAQPLPKKAQQLPKEEAQPLPKKAQQLPKEDDQPLPEKEAEPLPKQKSKLFKKNVAFSDETIFQLNHVVYENLPLPEVSEDEAPLLYIISPTGLFERIGADDIPARIQEIIHNNEILHPKLVSEPFSTFPFSEEARIRFHEAPPKLEKVVRILEMHKTSTVSVSTKSGFFVSIMLGDLGPELRKVVTKNRAMQAYKKAYGKFGIPPMYIYKPAPPYESLKEYFENTDHCVRETLMGLRVGAQEMFLLFPVNKVFFPPPDSPFLDSNSGSLAAEVCEIIEDMRKACVESNYSYNESFMEPYRSLPRLSDKLRKPDFLPTTNNFFRPCVLQSKKASEAPICIRPMSPVKNIKNGSEKPAKSAAGQIIKVVTGKLRKDDELLPPYGDRCPIMPPAGASKRSEKTAKSARQAIEVAMMKVVKKDDELQSYGDRCPIMPPAGASKRSAYQPIYPQLTDSLIDGGSSSERKKAASGHDAAPARPVSASAFYSACSEIVYPYPVPLAKPLGLPYDDSMAEVTKCVNARLKLLLGDRPNTPSKTNVPDSPLNASETSTTTKAASCHTTTKPNVCVPQATPRAGNVYDSLKVKLPTLESWNKLQSVWQDMPDSRSRPIPHMTVPHVAGGFQPPLPQHPSVTTPLFNRGGFQQPLPQDPLMTPHHFNRGGFQQPLPQDPSMTPQHFNRGDFQQPLPQNPAMSALHLNRGDFQQPLPPNPCMSAMNLNKGDFQQPSPLKKSYVDTTCQGGVDFQKPLASKDFFKGNLHTSESGFYPFFLKDPVLNEMKLKNTSSEEAFLYPPNNSCELQFVNQAPIVDLMVPPRPIVDYAVQPLSSNLKVTNTSVPLTNAWTPNYSNSAMGTTTVPVNPPYAHGNVSVTDTWPLSSDLKPSVAAEQKDKKTPNHLNSVVSTPMVPANPSSAPVTASEMTTRPLTSDSKPATSAEQKDKKKVSDEGDELQGMVWCPTCNLEMVMYDQDHLATLLKHMESSHKQTLCPICSDIYDLNEETIKCFKVHVNSHFD